MNENEKREDEQDIQDTEDRKKKEQEEREKIHKTAEMAVEIAAKGKMPLAVPLKDGDRMIEELEYDFLKLNGVEYADALDEMDDGRGTGFKINKKQAINLFCAAVAKCTPGLFQKEIMERLSVRDAINAERIATLFFAASSRAASFLITKQ